MFGGLLEGVRGELGSALRKAYHGLSVHDEEGIPACVEVDERAEPHVDSGIQQLISDHNLFNWLCPCSSAVHVGKLTITNQNRR